MKKFTLYILFLIFIPFQAFAQGNATIKGKVMDTDINEPVMFASVVLYSTVGDIIRGTATDEEGNYILNDVTPGEYLITVSSIGLADKTHNVKMVSGDNTVDFDMVESMATLDAVTISGSRRAQRITESSSAIQVINAKTIEVTKEPTAYGLLKNISGVDYMETGMGQQQVNARGFTSAFTGGMLTLIDYRSVALPGIGGVFGPAMAVNQNDIKQIEVIVGPNSALYGANAGQGVINIITKNPREYSGQSLTLRAGSRSQLGASFRTSNMLGVNKKWGYKLSAEYFYAEDFDQTTAFDATYITGDTIVKTNPDNRVQNGTVSGALYYFPTENTEISASGGYSTANYVNQSNIGDLQLDGFSFYYGQIRANFGNFFNLGSAFVQANYTGDQLGDTYNLVNVARRFGDPTNTLTEDELKKDELFVDKSKRSNIEFQHNFDLSKNVFTWGLQYTNTKPNSEGTFLSDGPDGNPIVLNDFGVYLQYEMNMIKNWSFFASGRYDNNDVFGGRFSPKIGVAFKPRNHNIRLVYNEAFGSPPIQPAFAQTFITTLFIPAFPLPAPPFPEGTFVPSVPVNMVLRGAFKGFNILDKEGNSVGEIEKLKPTIIKSYEAGYKGLFGNRLYIDATVFYSEYVNFLSSPQPINNPELILDATGIGVGEIPTGLGWGDLAFRPGQDPTPITYVEGFGNELVLTYFNYGSVTQWGYNIGLTFEFVKNWSVFGSYSYIKFNDFKDVPDFVLTAPNENTPNNKARFGLKFTNKKGVYVELAGRWIETFLFVGAQTYQVGQVPSYVVMDLKAETPFFVDGLVFGVSVNNLFDNQHIELPGTPELGFLGSAYFTWNFGGNKY